MGRDTSTPIQEPGTMNDRRFRFAASVPSPIVSVPAWRETLSCIEDLGFFAVAVADHFTDSYVVEPLTALAAAAMCTRRLRLQTTVLANDYRHPVLVHRMAATLDVLSEGRLELGLGAGWMLSDYDAAGLTYDPPTVRVARLEESIAIIKGLFGPGPFTHSGRSYKITALDGLPKPIQRPHPPIVIGGGSPRVLRLAAREADLVSIAATFRDGAITTATLLDVSRARFREKVSQVKVEAARCGRPPGTPLLHLALGAARITRTSREAADFLDRIAERAGLPPGSLADSPAFLVGTVPECVDKLEALRSELGVSYVQLDAGPYSSRRLEQFAPLLARLADT
jgi:probable F420-dependent oxidoreductase